MKFFQAGDEHDDIIVSTFALPVIGLARANDHIDHSGKAAAASPAFTHTVIDLGRHDQLPSIFFKKFDDRCLYILKGDFVAMTKNHDALASLKGRTTRRHLKRRSCPSRHIDRKANWSRFVK